MPIASQLTNENTISKHCITFDDGHLSNYTIAFPELQNQGLSAEFYVNSAFIGRPNYMTWGQLVEMSRAGMSIQSHGHTHSYFPDLPDQEIHRELEVSKKTIEDKLGNQVIVFAPPGGRYDKRVITIAKSLSYKCLVNSSPGICSARTEFSKPRFAIPAKTGNVDVKQFKTAYSLYVIRRIAKYRFLQTIKIILGNNLYDKIRYKMLDVVQK